MYKPKPSRIWSLQIEGNNVVIEDPVNLQKITIQENSFIGRNSDIENSIIGKNVHIGKNCIIENSIIEDGVWIDDGSILKHCRITKASVVGCYCVLINFDSNPKDTINDFFSSRG